MRAADRPSTARIVLVGMLQLCASAALPLSLAMIVGLPALCMVPASAIAWTFLVVRWLLKPDRVGLVVVRGANVLFIAAGAALCFIGKYALDAAERSAQRGGGLLGAWGFVPIAIGAAVILASLLSLALLCSLKPAQPA